MLCIPSSIMKHCTRYFLFSLSLVCMVYSSAPAADKIRNKRSMLENALSYKMPWRKLHNGNVKRNFDTLDLDKLFNDPIFLEATKENPSDSLDYNELDFSNLPGLGDLPVEKDEMSNVIPGAQGPYDFHPNGNSHQADDNSLYSGSAYPSDSHLQKMADSMMDEFMQYLLLKEMGMLDQCLGMKKKR